MKTRELYSIEDARSLLGGISRMTIYQLLNEGELESLMIGRRRFIPAGAIATFIATTTTSAAPSQRRAVGRHRAVQLPLELKPPKHYRQARRVTASR